MEKEVKKTEGKNSKIRVLLVIGFILLFLFVSYISIKSNYLELKELGENYEQVFWANMKYKYLTMGICFVILYIIMYYTNKGIKKSLKTFFDSEEKQMPKLPNKSSSLIFATIGSAIIGSTIMQKLLLFIGNTSFGINDADPVFNLDVGYYMFQKPLLEMCLYYLAGLIVFLIIYKIIYHVIVFNFCFENIDGKMLKNSLGLKKIIRDVRLLAITISAITIFNTQNVVFDKLMTIDGNIEVTGVNYTNSSVKLWGYIIFAIVITVSVFIATKNFKNGDKASKSLLFFFNRFNVFF